VLLDHAVQHGVVGLAAAVAPWLGLGVGLVRAGHAGPHAQAGCQSKLLEITQLDLAEPWRPPAKPGGPPPYSAQPDRAPRPSSPLP
jgi:hypothetical protein